MEKNLTWKEFSSTKMAVGTIVEVREFPEARKPAWKLEIDFGVVIGILKSSAQITDLYTANELVGRQIIAVVNFPAKQIGPFMSECLVLGAVGDERGIVILQPERKVANGLLVG